MLVQISTSVLTAAFAISDFLAARELLNNIKISSPLADLIKPFVLGTWTASGIAMCLGTLDYS